MKQYSDLIKHVLAHGTRKENRTGVDTISTFGYYYEHDMRDGFPLLTTKAVSWKNIVVEMLWFLSGQTDIAILKKHGCKFWDAWADASGKVPSAYGNFWRQFPIHQQTSLGSLIYDLTGGVDHGYMDRKAEAATFNDQIQWVLDEMKRNPMSRRMVVSAWAPGNAQMSKLPPCHCLFMFNVQNEYSIPAHTFDPNLPEPEEQVKQRLCLHLTQRSCDVALGVPYNIASYALMLQLFSRFSGIEAGTFGHTLVDAHVYTSKPDGSKAEFDHVPGLKEQLTRETKPLPRLTIGETIRDLKDVEALMDPKFTTDEVMNHFVLEGYDPHPAIPFKVAV
jgi:thymidylate synthase